MAKQKSKLKAQGNIRKAHVIKSVSQDNEMTLKDAKKIIKWQNEKIGEFTREIEWLRDTEYKRKEWLRDAKKEAGYNDGISFDTVWAETLAKARKTVL